MEFSLPLQTCTRIALLFIFSSRIAFIYVFFVLTFIYNLSNINVVRMYRIVVELLKARVCVCVCNIFFLLCALKITTLKLSISTSHFSVLRSRYFS